MLYTGNMSLRYLTVPVYTIFKNLTIIVIAYGEVLWFNGRVTSLALVSFGLMVMSSVVAALADIQSAMKGSDHTGSSSTAMLALNAGYMWMALNVICTAARLLLMKKIIKQTNDWDCMFFLTRMLLGRMLTRRSYVLQQPSQHPGARWLLAAVRKLVQTQPS
jgi:GDP-mannose transporter